MIDLQVKPDNFTSLYARALPTERAKVPLLEIMDDPSLPPIPESLVVLDLQMQMRRIYVRPGCV